MKKWLFGCVVLLMIATGYFAAGPYLTVAAIREGVANNDAGKLADNIDFPVLRQNIKDQLNAKAKAESERSSDNNIFSALMSGFKAKLVDNMVDSIITPDGLANLMAGKKSISRDNSSTTSPQQREDVFENARFTYDSLNRFSVWIPNTVNGELRLVLQRQGLSWKLVNLTLPQAERTPKPDETKKPS